MIEDDNVYSERDQHPAHPFTTEDRKMGDPNLCSQEFKGNVGTWICNRSEKMHPGKWIPKPKSAMDKKIENAVKREREKPFDEQVQELLGVGGNLSDLFASEESMIQKAKRHFNVAEELKAKYDSLPEDEATNRLWRNYIDEINLSRLAAQIAGEEDEIMHHRFERERELRRRDLR